MYFFKELFMNQNQISQESNRAIGKDPITKLTRYSLDSSKKAVLINLGDPHTTVTLITQFHTKKNAYHTISCMGSTEKVSYHTIFISKIFDFFLRKSFYFEECFPNTLCTCQIFA